MSSLNSTPDSNLMQLLIEGKPLSEEALRETGMDIAYLEACFEMVKPQLQYLGHYKPLEEHFLLPHWKAHYEHIQSSEIGEELCLRVRGNVETKRGQMWSLYIVPTFVHLFLTKSNWWVLVSAGDSPQCADQVTTELFESVRELGEYLDELHVKNSSRLEVPYTPQYSTAVGVALILCSMADARITEREGQLESMRSMADRMKALTKRVIGNQLP